MPLGGTGARRPPMDARPLTRRARRVWQAFSPLRVLSSMGGASHMRFRPARPLAPTLAMTCIFFLTRLPTSNNDATMQWMLCMNELGCSKTYTTRE